MDRNSSQDPDYEGPVYHERAVHKTHFDVPALKLKHVGPEEFEWIPIGSGRYKRVRKPVPSEKEGD
jgi:hypothetical protein